VHYPFEERRVKDVMFYYELFEALYKARVRYLVVGGLSVNLHGVPRVTGDVDLIIAMDRENIHSLAEVLKGLDFLPRLPVNPEDLSDREKVKTWIEEKNLKAFSFYHRKDNYKSVDIVLVHPLDFEKAFANRTVKPAKGIEIYVASIDDVICMKEWSGRKQDLSDAALLKRAKELVGKSDD
jgi:hypothetical protein